MCLQQLQLHYSQRIPASILCSGCWPDHAATAEGMRRAVRAGVDTIEGGYYGNEMK